MISIRMSKRIVAVSAVVLLSGVTALAQSAADNSQNGQPASSQSASSQSSSMSSGQGSAADKMFARKALEGGMAEVQLGQLASQNGGSEDVKQFGQKMVTDHTQLGDQLKPIAQQLGVNPPTSLSPKDQALMTKLQSKSGDQFDKAYIKAMLKDHHKDLKEFRKEARTGKDASLKQAASQGADVIQQHLQLAEQLAQTHHVGAPGGKNSGSSMTGQGSE